MPASHVHRGASRGSPEHHAVARAVAVPAVRQRDGEIARAKAQAALGWKVSVRIERLADGAALLRLDARDAAGAPLRLSAAEARLERPTARQADRSVTLVGREPGVYEAVLDEVAKGQWDLMLALADGRNSYRSRNRVVLR